MPTLNIVSENRWLTVYSWMRLTPEARLADETPEEDAGQQSQRSPEEERGGRAKARPRAHALPEQARDHGGRQGRDADGGIVKSIGSAAALLRHDIGDESTGHALGGSVVDT